MARIPSVKAFTGTSVEVLNAIRNSASTSYRDFVPFAQPDSESVKKIGAIIMQYPALQNEFLNNLINRIGLVIVTNKLYSNPWRMFKKGILEMGESVEEIFVNIAKVSQFDPSVAEETVFQRQIPDVRATFHIMNYQKFYKDTISDDQLRQAFVSWDGVTDLIARIVNSMYTAAEYDEFLMMRYMLGRMILDSNVELVNIPQETGVSDADYNRLLSAKIKSVSNNFTFLSPNYNTAGVMTHTEKSKQYLITTVDFDANLDVESLAFAFNMDKIQFAGNRILVPSFGFSDAEIARVISLLNYDPEGFEANELRNMFGANGQLDYIKCALVSEDFFRVYDNLIKFTEIYNSEGLYWNYSLHTWKTFSASPFENAVAFMAAPSALPVVTSATYGSGGIVTISQNGVPTIAVYDIVTTPAIGAGMAMPEYIFKSLTPYNIQVSYTDTIDPDNPVQITKKLATPMVWRAAAPDTNSFAWALSDFYINLLMKGTVVTIDFDTILGHQSFTVTRE